MLLVVNNLMDSRDLDKKYYMIMTAIDCCHLMRLNVLVQLFSKWWHSKHTQKFAALVSGKPLYQFLFDYTVR